MEFCIISAVAEDLAAKKQPLLLRVLQWRSFAKWLLCIECNEHVLVGWMGGGMLTTKLIFKADQCFCIKSLFSDVPGFVRLCAKAVCVCVNKAESKPE